MGHSTNYDDYEAMQAHEETRELREWRESRFREPTDEDLLLHEDGPPQEYPTKR